MTFSTLDILLSWLYLIMQYLLIAREYGFWQKHWNSSWICLCPCLIIQLYITADLWIALLLMFMSQPVKTSVSCLLLVLHTCHWFLSPVDKQPFCDSAVLTEKVTVASSALLLLFLLPDIFLPSRSPYTNIVTSTLKFASVKIIWTTEDLVFAHFKAIQFLLIKVSSEPATERRQPLTKGWWWSVTSELCLLA